MGKRDCILEVQSMLPSRGILGGWQVAKEIVALAEMPDDHFKKIGPRRAGMRRAMSAQEARRIVDDAKARIALADAAD
jgi:hypothetical protein